jgi:hypothetical protein
MYPGEHEFHLPGTDVQVDQGVVTVSVRSLRAEDQGKIAAVLEKMPGVVQARVPEGEPIPRRSVSAAHAATLKLSQSFCPAAFFSIPCMRTRDGRISTPPITGCHLEGSSPVPSVNRLLIIATPPPFMANGNSECKRACSGFSKPTGFRRSYQCRL